MSERFRRIAKSRTYFEMRDMEGSVIEVSEEP